MTKTVTESGRDIGTEGEERLFEENGMRKEGFKVLEGIGCLKKREIGGGDGRTERIAGVWMLRFRTK